METHNHNSDSDTIKLRPIQTPSSPITHFYFIISQFLLRIIAAGTSIAAACLMFYDRESKVLYGTNVDAFYSYSPAFKFFTMMNVVASAFSILSLLPVFTIGRKFSSSVNYFFLFLHDLMIVILLAGGAGAATTVAQIGLYGNSHAGWVKICDNFGKFCHKVASSLVLAYIAIVCYFLLAIISANKARKIRA